MSILIEGATIVSMDPERGSEPFQGNILIEGERIAAIGETGTDVEAERVISGHGKAGDTGPHQWPHPHA